jgi:hypothetical protein
LQEIHRICAEYRQILSKIAASAAVALLVSACAPAVDTATTVLPEATPAASCGGDGYLSTELFGALASKIEWHSNGLECEGMPRPDNDGVRLRFAGTVQSEQKIAFIIALPGLQRGETGKEYQSKVTLIEEGAGRFFSTGERDICWTDIAEMQQQANSDSRFSISGTLYCVAPLIEINGDSDITISDLSFRGMLDWDAA